jgi:hypothetical protein
MRNYLLLLALTTLAGCSTRVATNSSAPLEGAFKYDVDCASKVHIKITSTTYATDKLQCEVTRNQRVSTAPDIWEIDVADCLWRERPIVRTPATDKLTIRSEGTRVFEMTCPEANTAKKLYSCPV